MMKSGAPPDKFRFLYHMNSMVSQAELIVRLSFFGSWSYLNFFRDGMGPFNFLHFVFVRQSIYQIGNQR